MLFTRSPYEYQRQQQQQLRQSCEKMIARLSGTVPLFQALPPHPWYINEVCRIPVWTFTRTNVSASAATPRVYAVCLACWDTSKQGPAHEAQPDDEPPYLFWELLDYTDYTREIDVPGVGMLQDMTVEAAAKEGRGVNEDPAIQYAREVRRIHCEERQCEGCDFVKVCLDLTVATPYLTHLLRTNRLSELPVALPRWTSSILCALEQLLSASSLFAGVVVATPVVAVPWQLPVSLSGRRMDSDEGARWKKAKKQQQQYPSMEWFADDDVGWTIL